MEKLTEDEMNQLKILLIRYLAYRAQGIFNMAVDELLARFKANTPVIDVTPVRELPPSAPTVKRKGRIKVKLTRAIFQSEALPNFSSAG